MSDLFLCEEEIKKITGKKQAKKQISVLEFMGYRVQMRPDGSFWVPRAQFLSQESATKEEKTYKLNFGAITNGKAA